MTLLNKSHRDQIRNNQINKIQRTFETLKRKGNQ